MRLRIEYFDQNESTHLLLASRWDGCPIGGSEPTSVFILLVPPEDVRVDYARVSAGMTPFTIDGIERPGFTQSLRAAPILSDRQALDPHER